MSTLLLNVLLAVVNLAAAPVTFYVAPGGDDGGPGTFEAPFATVQRAQTAVRTQITDCDSRNIIVYSRGGVYHLDAPLVFTPADGGEGTQTVTYKAYEGETPLLS